MIVAEFKGKTSCGFKTGGIYVLSSKITTLNGEPVIWIYDVESKYNNCPYSSLESFLENWKLIK